MEQGPVLVYLAMRPLLYFLVIVLGYFPLSAQDTIPTPNPYEALDARVRAVRYDGHIERLVSAVTEGCQTEIEKARALFIWVTENTAYDYKAYNRRAEPDRFKCDDAYDCREKQAKYERDRAKKVLETGKDVCEGYALLYQQLCGIAGIRCSLVRGYTKNRPAQIGRMGVLDHAWNVLRIDDRYLWVDCTWAAGYCPEDEKGNLTGFVKSFRETYWIPPARRFFRDHFPEDEKWLEDSGVTKNDYKNGPYYYPDLSRHVEVLSPASGTITAKVGDTVSFQMRITDFQVGGFAINGDPSYETQGYYGANGLDLLPYKRLPDDVFEFSFRVESPRTRFIEVYVNDKKAVRFLVMLRK